MFATIMQYDSLPNKINLTANNRILSDFFN